MVGRGWVKKSVLHCLFIDVFECLERNSGAGPAPLIQRSSPTDNLYFVGKGQTCGSFSVYLVQIKWVLHKSAIELEGRRVVSSR